MEREARTIEAMVDIYCRREHGGPCRCAQCQELLDYSLARLRSCPFAPDKPTCAHCAVHCYRPDMRAEVRAVMRRAGPHMTYRHPILAFMHLLVDARRPTPDRRRRPQP
jgi:hypothetical protein